LKGLMTLRTTVWLTLALALASLVTVSTDGRRF
jgi:hypothetical protein